MFGGHDQVFEPETAPFSAGQTFVGKLPGEPLPWRQFVHAKGVPHIQINARKVMFAPAALEAWEAKRTVGRVKD